ncbi:MAG: TetR family transcriptional regulator [Lachnospiraceae bacterium]|jgi:probable dihydroxyacetone kinase regulator|nr:TetR family transcriptional regulator [Lachnospiraceae bacterium]MCX4316699.1 TetR/AcrR family transcriptional regulator C-terminal domain-containing protein [Lachnospiraceae bacterium]
MERKKEMTKTLLGESLRELMEQYPFEKITIKMITDEAGVIRPTFYHYFQDKYEVLEWLFEEEVLIPVTQILESDLPKEAVKLLFVRLEKEKAFYRKALEITGQNSFEEVMRKKLTEMLYQYIHIHRLKPLPAMPLLNDRVIAGYYGLGVVSVIKAWIAGEGGLEAKASDVVAAYEYVLTHSIFDIMEVEEN